MPWRTGTVAVLVTPCEPGGSITVSTPAGHELSAEHGGNVGGNDYLYTFSPCDLYQGSDLPGATFNLRYVNFNPAADTDVRFTLGPDKEKPTLKTTSQPPKGTKVKPDDRIVVRMEASEEYGDARKGWQSGVKKIQLRDESLNRDVVPHFEDSGPPRPCGQKIWKQWLEVTYTVPPNPPPVIKLRSTAWDHAGNKDEDVGEFPTGDFYGTFTATTIALGQDRFRTRADIVLNHDRRGNLTGTMAGQLEYVAHSTPNCSFRMVQPNRFRVSLVGSLTEGSSPAEGPTLKVFIGEIEETALTAQAMCGGGGGPIGPLGGWKFKNAAWTPEAFLGTQSPLGEGEALADGTREYKFAHMTSDGGTRWTVTLRRARN